MSLHSAPQMSLNGIENNSKDMNFLPDHSPVIIFALMMLSHNSIVINLIPLHRLSETSKFHKSIIIAFFSNCNSCKGKSAILMEFKNSGVKENASACWSISKS